MFGKCQVVNIQARKITDNLASLVKQVDSLVDNAANKTKETKHAFVVFITDDPEASTSELENLAEKHGIENIPLTLFDGISGPEGYGIAEDAEVTVMMWADQKVAVNHAFGPGKLDEDAVEKVVKDAKKHLE